MRALHPSLDIPRLSPAELRFLRTVADDTEEAPWMVMNDRQFWGASGLAWSLEQYARTHDLPWYVGGMLPLTYLPAGAARRKQVAPDVFVAMIEARRRESLAIEEEGTPPFVLEVVSGSSVKRDLEEKTEIYRLLGAQEYAIARLDLALPRLEGYRRDAGGAWRAWPGETGGGLWSTVLELRLELLGDAVRAVTAAGEILHTLPEAEAAWQQAEAARAEEAHARRQAEAELERLRAELERLTRGGGGETTR
jgi:Uma2 family endonuclease